MPATSSQLNRIPLATAAILSVASSQSITSASNIAVNRERSSDHGTLTCLTPCSAAFDPRHGRHQTFTATATDAGGNTSSQSVTFTVSFAVFALSDPTRPQNNVRVEVELRDANGVNVSSPSIALTAQSIDGTMPLSGTFTYAKAKSGAYKYDVPGNVSSGAHYFTASGDPAIHGVAFTAR